MINDRPSFPLVLFHSTCTRCLVHAVPDYQWMIDDDGKFDAVKARRPKWTALRERNIRNVIVWRPTKLTAVKVDVSIRHDVVGRPRAFQPS